MLSEYLDIRGITRTEYVSGRRPDQTVSMTRYRCNFCNVFEYEPIRGSSITGIKLVTQPEDFARLTGNGDVHKLSPQILCTTNEDIVRYTGIPYAGVSFYDWEKN
jgi:hypothetical protein